MSFIGLLNNTIDIIRFNYERDDRGGASADDATVVHSGIAARVQDHQPKLHGNQVIDFDQPVIKEHHDVFVAGLFRDLGGNGNGYGVVIDGVTVTRIANIQRFRKIGGMPDHCILICEEVSS